MTTQTATQKKITLSTVKSFIKKNQGQIYLNVKSSFDGMTDATEQRHEGFKKAQSTNEHMENSQGIDGAWFVGYSRDYFSSFENEAMRGIQVTNSCGRFILAVSKND